MSTIQLAVADLSGETIAVHARPSRDEFGDVVPRAMKDYEGPLVGYANSFLDDWELSRDVVQDTFLKLHREIRVKGAPPEALKAWLYTVCRNRSLDVIRKNRRMTSTDSEILESAPDETPSPARQAEQADQHQRAIDLLDRLPENQQEVIRLKFQGDLSYQEIADVTSLSSGNVGYLLHHGLKRLRELMTETI